MTPPAALLEALRTGRLTRSQIRELIKCEADELGLSYKDAKKQAEQAALSKGPTGTHIEYLFDMLNAA